MLTAAFVLVASLCAAQSNGGRGDNLPGACVAGDFFVRTGGSPAPCVCGATNTWTCVTGGASESVPAGAIILIDTGTCPTGYTENSALSGKTILGTVAANKDVGTTGGSDAITPAGTVAAPVFTGSSANTNAVSAGTPAGTNSAPPFTGTAWSAPAIAWPINPPTFTGSALATHAHELPWQMPTTTTIRQIAVATFGTGTSRAATAVSAAGTANTTSAAVALSQAVTAGTPAGTIAYPANVPTIGAYTPAGSISAPTFTGTALGTHQHAVTATGTNNAPAFTGTQFDNRSSWVKVIACVKT